MTKIISNGFSVTPVYDGEDGAPGKDGESALAADITNEMDSVAMDSGGAVLAQTVLTTRFNMWFGTSRQSLSALTASGAATGVTVSCNASTGVVTITIAAGTTLTGDKNVIALTGVCSKGERTVQFSVAGVRGGENGNPAVVYSLVTSASEIVKKKDGSYNPTGNITCAVTKNVGGNQSTPAASEYTLKMKVNGGAEQNYAPVASNTVTSSIEFILYVNGVVVDRETVPLLEDGTNGVSTNSVTEYYLATSAGSGVTRDTAGWTTTIQTITSTNKYLWNYEVITYSDGSTSATDPVIIGTYGRDGTNGTSISSVTEYYLATSANSGVTRDTAGWTTSVQTITTTNKYLWNYVVITYSNGSTTSTDPVIIGAYGETGQPGSPGSPGERGKTGPMFYLAGSWDSITSYTRNDDLCPVVYYSSEYWYLKNNGTYKGYTPNDSSSVWGKAQNFNMVFTDVLFAKTFALLGSWVVNQDWFISQYGVNKPNSSTSQENSNAYTNFRASDPQAQGPTYPCFSPYLKIDAKSGAIYAMKGSIGGFTIDSKILTNSDWEAGIEISYDGKSVKIGKNAKGDMGTEDAIIRAENTKSKSTSSDTYNTALYLNAAGARYNYAFYGIGNGVLNGYVQGYKVKVLNSIGASNYLYLQDGMVQAIASVGTNSDKYLYLPTLADCRKTLGIPVDNTKDFCCTIIIINQSAITTTTYNRDNVYVRGDTHDYATAITSLTARPVVLAQGNPKYLDLENCSMAYITITYINKRFIANYIKTTW